MFVIGIVGLVGGSEKKLVGIVLFGWSNWLYIDVEMFVFKGDCE